VIIIFPTKNRKEIKFLLLIINLCKKRIGRYKKANNKEKIEQTAVLLEQAKKSIGSTKSSC